MDRKKEVIDAEARALWEELHHCAAPRGCHGKDLLNLIMRELPVCRHTRFYWPYLRPNQVVMPEDLRPGTEG
jgi:hypothetical protein